jgi:hypothetical protein
MSFRDQIYFSFLKALLPGGGSATPHSSTFRERAHRGPVATRLMPALAMAERASTAGSVDCFPPLSAGPEGPPLWGSRPCMVAAAWRGACVPRLPSDGFHRSLLPDPPGARACLSRSEQGIQRAACHGPHWPSWSAGAAAAPDAPAHGDGSGAQAAGPRHRHGLGALMPQRPLGPPGGLQWPGS